MASTKTTEKALFKKFLKERGLTQQYKTFQRLTKVPKQTIRIVANVPGIGNQRKEILVTTEGKKRKETVFRDKRTLKILGRSKRKRKAAIDILKRKVDSRNVSNFQKKAKFSEDFDGYRIRSTFRDRKTNKAQTTTLWKDIEFKGDKRKDFGINLDFDDKLVTYNTALKKNRTQITTRKPKSRKRGNAVVDVFLTASDGSRKRIVARGKSGFLLTDDAERQEAIESALHKAMVVAAFSPTKIEIQDIYYEYRFDSR